MGGSGGGGNSGAVSYQAYMSDFHSELLSNGVTPPELNFYVEAEIDTIAASNPYTSKDAYDPDTRTTEIQDQFDLLNDTFLTTSDEFLFEYINSITDTHRLTLMQSTNRVAGMFFDINAVVGTAYPAALALLEVGFNRDVANFRLEANKARSELAVRSVDLQHSISRTKIGAEMDEDRQNLAYDIEEDFWVLNTLLRGGSALGLVHGGSQTGPASSAPSTAQSVFSGAATGASIGAQSSNPYGIAIGAVVGGLAGFLGN